MVRAAPDHAGAPPAKLVAFRNRVRFAWQLPAEFWPEDRYLYQYPSYGHPGAPALLDLKTGRTFTGTAAEGLRGQLASLREDPEPHLAEGEPWEDVSELSPLEELPDITVLPVKTAAVREEAERRNGGTAVGQSPNNANTAVPPYRRTALSTSRLTALEQ